MVHGNGEGYEVEFMTSDGETIAVLSLEAGQGALALRPRSPARPRIDYGEMMLRYLGWIEAADLILQGMDGDINAKTVTYDFAHQMEGAKEVKCSELGDAVVGKM